MPSEVPLVISCGYFHNTRCSCSLTVTRRVSPVELELLTLPEHMGSLPVFCGVRVAEVLFSV